MASAEPVIWGGEKYRSITFGDLSSFPFVPATEIAAINNPEGAAAKARDLVARSARECFLLNCAVNDRAYASILHGKEAA